MPGMPYEQKETTLVSGDDVLLCTDGLVEAHNSTGEMFGSPRLRGVLSKRSESGRELSGVLMEELARFTGKDGSRRTTSPSSRYDARRPDTELLSTP
jgi:serine phosphatase RsbU (regulator of sigma subunit)